MFFLFAFSFLLFCTVSKINRTIVIIAYQKERRKKKRVLEGRMKGGTDGGKKYIYIYFSLVF